MAQTSARRSCSVGARKRGSSELQVRKNALNTKLDYASDVIHSELPESYIKVFVLRLESSLHS